MAKANLVKLNPEVKARWVSALRSGNYEQIDGLLHSREGEAGTDKYCCLGVLCKVKEKVSHKKVLYKDVTVMDDQLPEKLLSWSGLDRDTEQKLIEFNDGGKSFKYIAAYIERYL